MLLSPLERAGHRPVAPEELQQKRWQRLERRVASLLLKAIPTSQKEELVAGKSISTFSIMAHLQVIYQPGGLGEKETILRNLESPVEANTLQEAVVLLRKWCRWRARARDIGVAEPDPSVLMRGLNRLARKVLDAHADLRFRVTLARSTLLLDSAPTAPTVERYVTMLLAECEQIAHTERGEKKNQTNPSSTKPKFNEAKVKKEDAEDRGGKGKGKNGDSKAPACRYYLTDEGCRKGKECNFSHVGDGERRCYSCGSKSHYANNCPRQPKDDGGKSLKVMQKVSEKDKDSSSSHGSPEKASESGDAPSGGNASQG